MDTSENPPGNAMPLDQGELLTKRLKGALPHIDFAGTDFTVDWRLKELRETEEPWKCISFNDDLWESETGEYLCFYNLVTHNIYMPPEDLVEIPQNIVVLEIPNELDLDPVAVARGYGLAETTFLNDHPIRASLAAKVKPLAGSGLPEFIEANIKRLAELQNAEERSRKRGR
jgi:hypothetical protein